MRYGGPYLKKQHVLFQCDNNSLVTCISKGYSKDPSVMHLRCLWFFIAFLDIRVSAEHIAGVANCAADMLSRNNITNFLLLQSQTSRLPTPLPAPLLIIITPKARLDISQLPQSVQQYYTNNAAKKHMEYLLCRPAALSDLFLLLTHKGKLCLPPYPPSCCLYHT